MKGESRFKTLVSFRDIVRLLNEFLKDARIEEVVQKQLIKGFSSSIRNLLFDFCLAALDSDNLDARLYLDYLAQICLSYLMAFTSRNPRRD